MRDVLVVDEGPVMRRILRLSLEDAGFAVRFARDEAEARASITARQPDVLIADIDMPATDGPRLLAWIQTTFPSRAFPVVFMSAHASRHQQAWVETPDTILLEKPFSVRRLIQTLGKPDNPAIGHEIPSDQADAGHR